MRSLGETNRKQQRGQSQPLRRQEHHHHHHQKQRVSRRRRLRCDDADDDDDINVDDETEDVTRLLRPPRRRRRRRRRRRSCPAPPRNLLRILMVFAIFKTSTALTCLTCMYTSSTTQLDNFRVSTRLARPQCAMEPIKCDRDQDVCVTITMHVGGGDYWMGAGCDRRVNFQHMSCQNVRTMSRNVQLGYVQERRAMQRVCVCARDLCNSAPTSNTRFLMFLLVPSVLLHHFLS